MIQRQSLRLLFLIFCLSGFFVSPPRAGAASSAANPLASIEPPSWWTGMANKQLQLMLHGQNIAKFNVTSPNLGWQIKALHRTDNPNYLFIDLEIAENAKAGDYRLELVANGKVEQTLNYSLLARDSGSAERVGFSAADVVYLITPDRFANGDESNDQVNGLTEGTLRDKPNSRHGGDIQGVIDHLDYIAKMGFSQIWLMPVLQNNQPQSSYHGYSITDFYQVDGRLGDNTLYQKLSKAAKAKGIGLIFDMVLNHIGSSHPWMTDMPSADWINHGTTFVPTNHRREALHDPHGAIEDREAFSSGWFVPSMPDLNQRNPYLANYLIQNSIWWIENAGLSGIRIDTWSYSDKNFLGAYSQRILNEYPNINLVGEEWTLNQAIVAYWQRGKKRYDDFRSDLPSLMDFPTQHALVEALNEKESWSDGLRKLYIDLAADFVYPDPGNLMVLADNHDMSRIFTQLHEDVALTKMALAFVLTTRGIPQIFYGTEILMDNPGTDSHDIIRSEFPGGWRNSKSNAFTGEGLSDEARDMQAYMRKLVNWRKQTPVVQTGELTQFAPDNGIYVYFRHSAKKDQAGPSKVMVVMNKNLQAVDIEPHHYASMIAQSTKAVDMLSGKKYRLDGVFKVPAKSALILSIED